MVEPQPEPVDVWSGSAWPACALSNLTAHEFVVDEQTCASVEGFLQSLKFSDPVRAQQVRQLSGRRAKQAGRERAARWQGTGTLHWLGRPIERDSDEYQWLLDRAYFALFTQCEDAALALKATGRRMLVHTRGRNDPTETVLTADEFCSRLLAMRTRSS